MPNRIFAILAGALAVPALCCILSVPASRADCPDTPACDAPSVIPPLAVGSPSGLAQAYNMTLRFPDGRLVQEPVWLSMDDDVGCGMCGTNAILYGTQAEINSAYFHCGQVECAISQTMFSPFVLWPYIETSQAFGGASFSPRFGGHGTLAVQIEADEDPPHDCRFCGGYVGVICITARSTDFDADGNTDQNEKITLGRCLKNGNCPIDYDLDGGGVGPSDYVMVAEEQQRPREPLFKCAPCMQWPCMAIPLNNMLTFQPDTSPPDATQLAVGATSGCSTTIQWTSPGNDVDKGDRLGVPAQYDLRYSSSPITESNFNSAIQYAGVPAPGLAGATQSVTVDPFALNAKFWALKTRDQAGNWSAMSNVLQVLGVSQVADLTVCETSRNCVLLSWGGPLEAVEYDLRYSTSPITNCNFGSAWVASAPPTVNQNHEEKWFVEGLASGTTYYFAIKTRESASGPWGPMSNLAVGTTKTTGVGCDYDMQNHLCDPGGGFQSSRVPQDPVRLQLAAPAPNPAEGTTWFKYAVPQGLAGRSHELAVFDITGRRVATLAEGNARTGWHGVRWDLRSSDGRAAQSGMYFVRLRIANQELKRSVVIP